MQRSQSADDLDRAIAMSLETSAGAQEDGIEEIITAGTVQQLRTTPTTLPPIRGRAGTDPQSLTNIVAAATAQVANSQNLSGHDHSSA